MDGHMEVKGRVLYASQEAWVFSGTLRENILFGQSYQPDRYSTIMEACALDKVRAWKERVRRRILKCDLYICTHLSYV